MSAPRLALRDLDELDASVYSAIARTSTPVLDSVMRRLSRAADYSRLSMIGAGVLSVTYGEPGRRAARFGLAAVGVTSFIANLVAKPLAGRPRPLRDTLPVPVRRQVSMPLSRSFPSGHSASAFAFATAVGHVLPPTRTPLALLAAAVAYSRIHTGVHYPSDTIAGAVLGVVIAEATTRALERHDRLARLTEFAIG
jgi:membrane-associated phospholipid phosphatase